MGAAWWRRRDARQQERTEAKEAANEANID